MIRRTAAVVLALTIFPAVLHAQDTVLTVMVQSADVHKGPSTGSPVIGHAPKGDALPVVRDLGSWLEVSWLAVPEGVGYVHTTTGRLNIPGAKAPAPTTSSRTSSSASASTPAAGPMSTAQRTPASAGDLLPPSGQAGGSPISHIVGVGGMVGTMSSFGATARWWRNKHLGVQVGLTRDAMSSDTAAGRVTTMQIEPGVVYALFDRVPGYVWVRPYVGSALSFRHETWKDTAPVPMAPLSDNGVGYRLFGGTELTFASVTQLGLSAELGYRKVPTPFAGFEADKVSAAIIGHWYIK